MATLNSSPKNDRIKGTASTDFCDGLAGNDVIVGLAGDDTLLGGLGNDSLDGGIDNDFLQGDAGNDTLMGGAGDDSLNGGADKDKLDGGAGADTLDGGTGADSLIGGDGDDVYFVDNIGDRITEAAKITSGIDLIMSSVNYTLPMNLENLELTGLANLTGTGNSAANIIIGNVGNNLLTGGGGSDTLEGGDGNDTLDGGSNADTLIGGKGSDTYLINSAEDTIIETAQETNWNQATLPDQEIERDVVISSINYTLGDYLEKLILTGTKSLNGAGNNMDNILVGNPSANVLSGKDGDDTLLGDAGDDQLEGGAGNDKLDGGKGNDLAVYLGNRDNYQIYLDPLDKDRLTWVVTDINGTEGDGVDEGTDRLTGIETFQFADGLYVPGQPKLSVADISVSEGNTGKTTATFTLILSEPATRTITVLYHTENGTANDKTDYIGSTGSISFAKGKDQKTLSINVLGDKLFEANETFILRLSDANGAELERTKITATITNDDVPTVLISDASINENAGSMLLTVSLSAATTKPVSVQYSTTDGTATAGKDYTQTAGTLNFAPGEIQKTFALNVLDDTQLEKDETLRVLLSNPKGAVLSSNTSTSSAQMVLIDNDAVGPTLSSDKTSLKEGETATLRFNFSDVPKNFTVSDINATGGNISGFKAETGGKAYTAKFTPTTQSDTYQATFNVAAGSFTSSVGKPGLAGNTLSLTGDTLAPSLSVSSDKTSLKADETATLTFNFSELPSGFDNSHVSITGGTLSPINGTGLTRTAVFTPTANTNKLSATIDVAADVYTDAIGNKGDASNRLSLTGDTQLPGLSISSKTTTLKVGDTATMTFTFSELPTGFDGSDISVTGGTLAELSGTGLTRTAVFTPTADTNTLTASLSVAASTYTDAIGNNGLASNTFKLTGDTLVPSLTISSDKTSLKAGDTATLTFTFSELPSGFDSKDISMTGGTLGTLNGTGLTRTAVFTPTTDTQDLNVSINVAASTYTDAIGNNGLASNTLNLTGDTFPPRLTISSDKTSLKASETATLTFLFSELP
ncbi:MAG: Ig-like domain-containing protein, partial [Methylococcaceae bacterium]